MPARILVIEDNSDNLELMSYLLTAFGHTVLKAMDGVEGLQLARRDKPDLVLCDLQMRKLDGFEVVRPARQEPELSDVRIVAVTAYAMREDQDKVMAAGFDGYITKPIVPEEFASRAEEFLRADLRSGTQPRASVAQKPQSVPRPLGARATILAVDDRQVNLSLIRSILEPSGYEVIAVETVSKAIQFARQNPPDVILSDLHIPETSGYQFLENVRKDLDLSGVPFILMSSSVADPAGLAKGLNLGATRVLFRPLEPEVLLLEIEACLGGR